MSKPSQSFESVSSSFLRVDVATLRKSDATCSSLGIGMSIGSPFFGRVF